MKLFLKYLQDFIKEDFHLMYYFSVGILLVIAITLNYSIDLEDGVLDRINGFFPRMCAFFMLYGGLYLFVILINQYFFREKFIKNQWFWLSLSTGVLILSIDVALHPAGIFTGLPSEVRLFITKTSYNIISLFTTLIPLYLFYKMFDRQQPSFYGLTKKGFIASPYLQLFTLIIPLAIAGSYLPGFLQQYPMYISTNAHLYWNMPEWITVISYELAYGWNFLSVELLFRGFLVIGLTKYLGRHAIIPMVVVYCSIHFGKPMGECISSVFGGYILGVIAYYSRNIWGGVVLHVGLAWLMEIVSAIHKALL